MSTSVTIASIAIAGVGEVRVALDMSQNPGAVDIRHTTALAASSGIQMPTKFGVRVPAAQLPALVRALQTAALRSQTPPMRSRI